MSKSRVVAAFLENLSSIFENLRKLMKSSLQVGFNKCVKMPLPVEKIIGFLFDEAAVVNSFDAVT